MVDQDGGHKARFSNIRKLDLCGLLIKVRHITRTLVIQGYIRHLKNLQALTESDIRAMNCGGHPTKRANRWKRLENRLVALKMEYRQGDRDLDDYWTALSHLVQHY